MLATFLWAANASLGKEVTKSKNGKDSCWMEGTQLLRRS